MVLIKCHENSCNEYFESIDALQIHFTIKHPTCTYFRCNIDTCRRSFNVWNSFRKHLSKNHDMPNRFDNSNNVIQIDSVDSYDQTHTETFFETNVLHETELFDNISPSDFYTMLEKHANILISQINTKPGLPRNQVESIIENICSFLSGSFLNILEQKVLNTLSTCHAKAEDINSIQDMFKSLSNPFHHLSTEYKRIKYFKSTGAYIPPETYYIDSCIEKKNTKNGVKLQMKPVTAQYISLRKVLKKFFELPDAFNSTIQYMQQLQTEPNMIYNFIQCERWRSVTTKYFKQSDIVFPLLIYYDDWEPNNPLGPHLEKIGAVYVTVPCLPPECQSKLDNIFLALLFHSNDRKNFGNRKTFAPLINELIFLETEGIEINTMKENKRVYFATSILTGDNLGIHSMCGLVESFSAKFMCRFCKASKLLTEVQCTEDLTLLRTSESYQNDLSAENASLTGIKEECIFNVVPSIDIIEMPFVDGMHDCLEGIGHYSMIPILKHFSQLDPLFIETLNCRINMFDYGPYDSLNKPRCITLEMLEKSKLKMTANEMSVLVRLFGIFIGDLVHENDEFWQLYLLLHDIFSIIQAKRLPSDIKYVLQILTKEHNELYLRITGEKLKPKHHFLLHYARIFNYMGPFANVSCMRFEAMHKRLKAYCTATESRKNLLLSLAIKFQLSLCYRFTTQCSILSCLLRGPGKSKKLSEFPQYSFFKLSLPNSLKMNSENYCMNWIEWKNVRYKLGFALITGTDSSGDLCFGLIKIILLHEGEPLFICSPLFNIGLNSHVKGYEVECDNENDKWFCIKGTELVDYQPLYMYQMANGERYIVLKYFL
ncbi:PREDICTED: uncharacterized protein LOC105556038 [Vollenhovia emeryi]|uniref:uncharacterized protein LOC105556038 n=1 Tax=Vollenhovia emeryi TaxID=411798 RepID=UPI0005F3C8E6|nr:PREDICTED: uncharacterized protein LOC105556038 [Vollenhovia emeryi]